MGIGFILFQICAIIFLLSWIGLMYTLFRDNKFIFVFKNRKNIICACLISLFISGILQFICVGMGAMRLITGMLFIFSLFIFAAVFVFVIIYKTQNTEVDKPEHIFENVFKKDILTKTTIEKLPYDFGDIKLEDKPVIIWNKNGTQVVLVFDEHPILDGDYCYELEQDKNFSYMYHVKSRTKLTLDKVELTISIIDWVMRLWVIIGMLFINYELAHISLDEVMGHNNWGLGITTMSITYLLVAWLFQSIRRKDTIGLILKISSGIVCIVGLLGIIGTIFHILFSKEYRKDMMKVYNQENEVIYDKDK